MSRYTLTPAVLAIAVLVATPSRATAQGYPVFDPASFIELVSVVREAQRIYQTYVELREMWDRFRRALPAGAKDRYVLPNMRWRTEGLENDPFGLYSPIIEDAVTRFGRFQRVGMAPGMAPAGVAVGRTEHVLRDLIGALVGFKSRARYQRYRTLARLAS